jgi:hypothetical protein
MSGTLPAGLRIFPAGDSQTLSTVITDCLADLPQLRSLQPASDNWGEMVRAVERLVGEPR